MTDEIPEADAPPEIATLYREIRAATGAGMVNLIYRHMATIPGCLPWAWGVLRPHAPALRALVATLPDQMVPADLSPWPQAALDATGIDQSTAADIRRMLDDYNRGNSFNLFAIAALGKFLAEDAERVGSSAASDAQPDPLPLPPILPMDGMEPVTAALVSALSAPIRAGAAPIIPSLYRHLAYWPRMLALTAAAILPIQRQGALDETFALARALSRDHAADLAQRLETPSEHPLPVGIKDSALHAKFNDFPLGPIATMVVIGHRLRALMGEHPD